MTIHRMGVTRACELMGISSSLFRYQSKRPEDGELLARVIALAGQKRRYGCRRLHVLLRREGWELNWKRTYRVYHAAGLMVRRRKRKRIAGVARVAKVPATGPNQSWSMDFVSDEFVNGRTLRCLANAWYRC
jgi:putative transposase